MVIEDDADFRRLIQMTLSTEPWLDIGGEATCAEDAIPLARSMQPDVIVLDHFIDGSVMGMALAPMLKREAPNARILLFSTHDLAVEASREPAIDAFLRKYDLTELAPTIRKLVGLD